MQKVCQRRLYVVSGLLFGGGFSSSFAVNTGGDDTAGIPCAFTGREQSADPYVVQGLVVAYYANRSRRAGLDTNHQGIVCKKTTTLSSEMLKAFTQSACNLARHPEVQWR